MIKEVFSGKFIKVTVNEGGVEQVFLRGSVHTFLVTDEKKIRLTIERKIGEKNIREKVQGGIIENSETALSCAKRELKEELGVEAYEWREFLVQELAGTINDKRYYFIAKDFKKVSETDGEILDTMDYSVEELYTKAMKGEFSPMTQSAIARLYFEVSKGGVEL